MSTSRPRTTGRRRPATAPAIQVRAARPSDLPLLQAWLRPGAARTLPAADARSEAWLVAAGSDDQPLACLRLRHAIGLDLPRHWYHAGWVVHAAPELGLFQRLQTLQLGNDLTGASELADTVWQPGLDAAAQAAVLAPLLQGALRLLRGSAPLPGAVPLLIAELPGLRDADGQSPFWQGLARPFFDGDPAQAAQQLGPAWRSHVATLMPRQPVHAAFLPAAARAAIGQAHPAQAVLAGLLRAAGLRPSSHVAIDDGGPVLAAPLDALVTVAAHPAAPA
jgi:arginine N-succinyltransferase